MSPKPRCSVIIPVRDDPRLARAVDSVLAQRPGSPPYEVVVVDNGSREPVTNTWGPPVHVVSEATSGSYAARNAGVGVAAADVLAFMDSDCIADPTWLQSGIQAAGPDDRIVLGPVEVFAGPNPSLAERFDLQYAFPQAAYFHEGWGVTANMFVPRSVFEGVGLFDHSLRSGGDREFCLRAGLAGVPVEWCDGAVVHHPARATIRELIRKRMRVERATGSRERADVGVLRASSSALWSARFPLTATRRGDVDLDLVMLEWALRLSGLLARIDSIARVTTS